MILTDELESTIEAVFQDACKYIEAPSFNVAYSRYFAKMEPILNCYQLHHSAAQNVPGLEIRFLVETAILHVFTILSSSLIKHLKLGRFVWPINETDSLYNWYRISESQNNKLEQLADFILEHKQIPAIFSQVSDNMLASLSQRYVGEFYTPTSIANHLIELSGFKPECVFNKQKIVDPACGGGIILTLIAQQSIEYALERNIPSDTIINALNESIWGFDIQPFAIALTRTQLILIIVASLKISDPISSNINLFPNIVLSDPLKDQIHYWQAAEEKFQFCIGNPPYMSVKKANIKYIDKYDKILYGHPNLYQLFLWWAVNSTTQNGTISFLIPQSILAGNFLQNLRVALHEVTNLLSVTRMIDRKGVVGEADHQMMALCLQIKQKPSEDDLIKIRVTRNGTDLSSANLYEVKHSRVVRKISESTVVWIVSDNVLDYAISERVLNKCKTLAELSAIKIGNGGYVWNQHKDLIHKNERPNYLPLVSSASIQPFGLTFPFEGSHSSRERQFSATIPRILQKIHSDPSVLLQRVTPKKAGRRVQAGYIGSQFLEKYPQYFLENHVNYIKVLPIFDIDMLLGILGWVNSDILNFVFQLRNGTSHLSVFELGLLPAASELLNELPEKVNAIINSSSVAKQKAHEAELNEFIFDWFELGTRHRNRVAKVLSRKERE